MPFLWERMQPTLDAPLDTAYFGLYDSLLQYIIVNKSATVIIDVHNYARYNGGVIGASGSGVTIDNFVNFWKLMAAKYKSRADLVIFGLMNEPNGVSSKIWFSAAQTVINSLRAEGFSNTILVPGNFYTGAWSWLSTASYVSTDVPVISNADYALNITDPLDNVVFEVHQYFDSDSSGTSPTCPTTKNATAIFSSFENWLEKHNKYGYLGEFAGAANSACQSVVTAAFERFANNPRWLGTSWWSGGPWWGNAWYLFQTSNLTGQVDQMTWQKASMIPNQRYTGYNPVDSSSVSVSVSWALLAFALAVFLF